jgi:3-dehydroquinate dehydratase
MERLGQKPLLLTFRTQKEGGEMAFSEENYFALYHELVKKYEKLTITVFAPTVPLLVVKDYIHRKNQRHFHNSLMLTFRTQKEGGEMAFSEENYFALYHELVKKGALDLLDIEVF